MIIVVQATCWSALLSPGSSILACGGHNKKYAICMKETVGLTVGSSDNTASRCMSMLNGVFTVKSKVLCDAAAAGVCTWATHLHFMLIPNDSTELEPEDLESIHPTHRADAMSALSAVATLDPSRKRQREQATCNTDASWLQQQLSSWSIPVPQLQQQAQLQPEVDNTQQHADLSTGASAAGRGSVLQVNVREVLGCGSTGIVFAGK